MTRRRPGMGPKRGGAAPTRPRTSEPTPPDELERAAAERRGGPRREDVARRVWQKDPTLWGGDASTPELADRLGWLTIADRMQEEADDLRDFARSCINDGLTDAVLLGMGGSSLAPEVFRLSFPVADHHLRL